MCDGRMLACLCGYQHPDALAEIRAASDG